jgi:hypothetical protein
MTCSGSSKSASLTGINGFGPEPQFVSNALGEVGQDKPESCFFDSSDLDESDNMLSHVKTREIDQTRRVVICTSDGMHESTGAYERIGWTPDGHAVSVASQGNVNDKVTKMSAASHLTSGLNAWF